VFDLGDGQRIIQRNNIFYIKDGRVQQYIATGTLILHLGISSFHFIIRPSHHVSQQVAARHLASRIQLRSIARSAIAAAV
jgi:hypothetical protein